MELNACSVFLLRTRESIWGGGEVFLCDIALELLSRGMSVRIAAPKKAWVRKAIHVGVKPHRRDNRYDFVLCNDFRSVWKSCLFDFTRSRIFVVHGEWQLSKLRARVANWFGVHVFVVNQTLAKKCRSLGIANPHVLPIGVNASQALTALRVVQTGQIVLGYVARLDQIKRHKLFLSICSANGLPGILVTPPPKTSREHELVREILQHKPLNVDFFCDGDASHVWSAASVFVHVAKKESLGLVLLEAMANNLLVISNDSPGPREIMTGILSAGILNVELLQVPGTLEKLVKLMSRFSSDIQETAASVLSSRTASRNVDIILDFAK